MEIVPNFQKLKMISEFVSTQAVDGLGMYYTRSSICKVMTSWLCKQFKFELHSLRPTQNGHHFPDDILKSVFLNENVWISNKISLNFIPKRPINNIPTLVQIMTWHQPGNKPLSEPRLMYILIILWIRSVNCMTLTLPGKVNMWI